MTRNTIIKSLVAKAIKDYQDKGVVNLEEVAKEFNLLLLYYKFICAR